MIRTLVFPAAKHGFKSVISIFCCSVSVGNISLHSQTLILPLIVIMEWYFWAPHRDLIWVCLERHEKTDSIQKNNVSKILQETSLQSYSTVKSLNKVEIRLYSSLGLEQSYSVRKGRQWDRWDVLTCGRRVSTAPGLPGWVTAHAPWRLLYTSHPTGPVWMDDLQDPWTHNTTRSTETAATVTHTEKALVTLILPCNHVNSSGRLRSEKVLG